MNRVVLVLARLLAGSHVQFLLQMTRTFLVCHLWSSVCLLTTLLRAQCGLTVNGNMVGEPRKTTGDPRRAGLSLGIQGPYTAENYLPSSQ